ncbi:nucleoporin [Blastopirellula marina]|uniref:Uncharacterized protein n=1 Tax=Blastopirellula marina TaxID=124 RepID=A0A2S8GKN1_9BACT|nr:nucleoporin [Blastopirellula marina]PQO45003.1 hypothetical protein C5Y93_15830 [Blastopirellula marina]
MSWLRILTITAATSATLVCLPAYGQFGGGYGGQRHAGGFGGGYGPGMPPAEPTPEVPSVQVTADYVNQPITNVEQRRAVEAKLLRRVNCQFTDTPLSEVLGRLQSQAGIDIRLDNRALEDVGLSSDVPVTFHLRQLRLLTTLDLMLRELDLTYVISEDRLIVTTPEEAESDLRTVYYPCDDLLKQFAGYGLDYDSLIQGITTCVEPEYWEELGGPGSVQPLNGGLVISQVDTIHWKIERLMAALRRAKGLPSENYDPTTIELGSQRFERERIDRALSVVLPELSLKRTPLEELVQSISQRTGVRFWIDRRAMEDVGLSPDVELTNNWRNVTAAVVLHDVFSQLELTGQYRDDIYVITTPEEAESELKLKLYPVRDFLAGENWATGADPFANGGGQPLKAERHYVADFDSLINTITTVIEPESWEDLGGPGAIQPYHVSDVLIVAQTDEIHKKLDDLLREIRAGRFSGITEPVGSQPMATGYFGALPENEEIVDRTHRLDWNVDPQQLADVARKLQQYIAPGSWDGEHKYLRTLGTNQFVVRHKPQIQRQIRDELQRMAASAESGDGSPAVQGRRWSGGGGGFFRPAPNPGRDPFAEPKQQDMPNPFGPPSPSQNPFGGADDADPFGAASDDPFAGPNQSDASNPFGAQPPNQNPFGGSGDADPFGAASDDPFGS